MSQKAYISAAEHLAKLDFTTEQALDFIEANIDQPDAIYITARLNGVTNAMLSEITNIEAPIISDYFKSAGRDPVQLDYTSVIINFDLGALESLVDFNLNSGILSNASLREAVQPLLDAPNRYDATFDPPYEFYPNDGNFDAEELGVGHLGEVPATNDSNESLFYGSLINLFEALDQSELNQLKAFPSDGASDDFEALLLTFLDENESPSSNIWTDEQLAELVTNEAVTIIDKFWNDNLVGVLDHSFFGLAIA